MGISGDIAPKSKPEAKPEPEPEIEPKAEEKIKLEPGEVEVGVNVGNKTTDDLYSDFLSDWDHNVDRSEDHHHHDHGHPEEDDDDSIKATPKSDIELPEKDKKEGGGLFKWIMLFFIVLIAIIVWQNYSKIAEVFNFSSDEESTDSTEDIAYYDNSATDYTTPAATEDATTTETPAENTTAIDKSTIAIQVLNGNGTTGSATVAKQVLIDAGFTVASTTNAKKYTYATSIVYYKTGKKAEAELVNSSLSAYKTELINEDSVMGIYDVIVLVGAT